MRPFLIMTSSPAALFLERSSRSFLSICRWSSVRSGKINTALKLSDLLSVFDCFKRVVLCLSSLHLNRRRRGLLASILPTRVAFSMSRSTTPSKQATCRIDSVSDLSRSNLLSAVDSGSPDINKKSLFTNLKVTSLQASSSVMVLPIGRLVIESLISLISAACFCWSEQTVYSFDSNSSTRVDNRLRCTCILSISFFIADNSSFLHELIRFWISLRVRFVFGFELDLRALPVLFFWLLGVVIICNVRRRCATEKYERRNAAVGVAASKEEDQS